MSGCVRQNTKKYLSRGSPAFPANQCCGMEKRGNDGEMYISRENSKGICSWKKVNGSRVSQRKSKRSNRASRGHSKKSRSRKSKRSNRASRGHSKKSRSRKSKKNSKKSCDKTLQSKIGKNIGEWKKGRYSSKKQALAVSYSQVRKSRPGCAKYYRR